MPKIPKTYTIAEITGHIKESAAYVRERLCGDAGASPTTPSDAGASPTTPGDAVVLPIANSAYTGGVSCADSRNLKIALVLGSGLGGFADSLYDAVAIPYEDIPHFPRSTAPGHKGRLICGAVSPGGERFLCMQGRFHLYEGYTMLETTWHIRVFKELGISRLILTNASGGLERDWNVGDLMLICDHINYMFQNPLTGPNFQEYGPRFPDMTFAYNPRMLDIVRTAASELSIPLREGVYVGFCGPSYETPAEIRMFRNLGASAVGMSTVPEAIVANHCGIKTCGISCITNYAAGILDQPLTEAEVIETAARTGPIFEKLLRRTIELLGADPEI